MDNGWLLLIGTLVSAAIGASASTLASRYTRRSQQESNQINEANGLVDRFNKLVAAQEAQAVRKEAEYNRVVDGLTATTMKQDEQISLWRRYSQILRKHIYGLGEVPPDPDDRLQL